MRYLLLAIVVCILLSSVTWIIWHFFREPITIVDKPASFFVAKGQSMAELAFDLYQRRIIKNPYYFLLRAKWQGQLKQIKAGEYIIYPGTTSAALLRKLVRGEVVMHKITFVEGWTFRQYLENLKSNPSLTHTLANQSSEQIMSSLGHPGQNPEGMFYPSTYLFAYGVKDSKILQMAYDLMQTKLQQAWEKRVPDLALKSPYEALILASVVEKETAQKDERPLVAGVFMRRLEQNIRLQSDVTVAYGMGDNLTRPLLRSDLRFDSPYNTFLHNGLPPTPIAMPSESSLEAAMHPSQGRMIYFMGRGDGTHVFSTDWQAHQAAVSQYRATKRKLALACPPVPQCVLGALLISYWRSFSPRGEGIC